MDHQCTPSTPAYRFPTALNLTHKHGRPADGHAITRQSVSYVVPSGAGTPFFVPSDNLGLLAAHSHLGKLLDSCSSTIANQRVPANVEFSKGRDLMLRVFTGEGVPAVRKLGEVWFLRPRMEMAASEYETVCQQLLPVNSVSGSDIAAAASSYSDPERHGSGYAFLDQLHLPDDSLTRAFVIALADLAAETSDRNTAMFASLYATDLRATDPEFNDVLTDPASANLVAAAVEAWVVRERVLWETAMDAHELVFEAVGYTPTEPAYKPYWEIDTLKFLDGVYTHAEYAREVKLRALAFSRDAVLEKKIDNKAAELFKTLATSGTQDSPTLEGQVSHNGLRFTVVCGSS